MQLIAKLKFQKGYVAHPYWPAQEKQINITKESGVNRARSEEKRVAALNAYLSKIGMTMAEFVELGRLAGRPFYQVRDLDPGEGDGHDPDEIAIPTHQLYGSFANACDVAPSAVRIAKLDQVRTILKLSPLFTGKTSGDGVWERFVPVKSGTGQLLSNQRALRSNEYLGPFKTELTMDFNEETVKADKLKDFVKYVGREIGVGASRKMGWGRFDVEGFNTV